MTKREETLYTSQELWLPSTHNPSVTSNVINNEPSKNDNNHNLSLDNENLTMVEDTLVTRKDNQSEVTNREDMIWYIQLYIFVINVYKYNFNISTFFDILELIVKIICEKTWEYTNKFDDFCKVNLYIIFAFNLILAIFVIYIILIFLECHDNRKTVEYLYIVLLAECGDIDKLYISRYQWKYNHNPKYPTQYTWNTSNILRNKKSSHHKW